VPLRVTFIGSGSAFADGGRSHACIHVTAPGVSLLLDCGGSSLPAIRREVDAEAIDAIGISHLHGDHFGGIPYLLIEQHFAGRTAPLLIGGPRALGERLRALESSLYPDFFRKTKLGFQVSEIVLGANETEFGGALVSALPVKHVAESDPHGLRVRVGDKLIAYSGDATWSDDLARVAKGADLFICDATFFDRDDPSHISYRTLMAHRDALDCKRIVLTHLGAETLARIGELEDRPCGRRRESRGLTLPGGGLARRGNPHDERDCGDERRDERDTPDERPSQQAQLLMRTSFRTSGDKPASGEHRRPVPKACAQQGPTAPFNRRRSPSASPGRCGRARGRRAGWRTAAPGRRAL
jgi:ribonuclease BN (tRNA processing enzyme)